MTYAITLQKKPWVTARWRFWGTAVLSMGWAPFSSLFWTSQMLSSLFIKHFWMSFWTSSLPPLLELGVSFFEVFPKPRVLHGPTAAVPRRRSPRLLAVERGPTDASCFRPRSKRLDRSKNGARVERPEHGLSFSLS